MDLVDYIVERPSAPKRRHYAKSILIFCAHQFVAMCGTGLLALLFGTSVYDEIDDWFHWHPSMHYLQWTLAGTPYYPLQIAVGLYVGWALYRHFQHRAMFYVWIIPLAILLYSLFTFAPESVLLRPGQSSLSHYLGWDCQARRDRCFDQLVTTMPFYAAVAYSGGALLARKMIRQKELAAK